jgi:hypothetical protein
MAPQPTKKKSKLPLILGGCCLVLLLISCVIGIWMYMTAQEVADQIGGSSFEAEMNRISLSVSLDGIIQTCAGDPSGASTAAYFHPNVAATYTGLVCTATPDTIAAFSDANRSTAANLAGSPDEFHATAQGIDAGSCFLYTSGTAKIIGCTQVDGFKLLHIENLNQVQP